MLERLLENWLDSVNERAYQPVFCQLLVGKKHTIIHNTRHHPLEFGKDIITLDAEGVPCAFQLKGNPGGQLTLSQYREVHEQLIQMAYQSLEYVGIKESHQCFLVTNGEIAEDVQRAINELNQEIEKRIGPERKIQLITRGIMLQQAIELEGKLWPQDIPSLRLLLEILSADGRELFPFKKLHSLLSPILYLDNEAEKPSETILARRIRSAGLLVALCLTPFSLQKNHFAAITAWCMYATYTIAACTRYGFGAESLGGSAIRISTDAIYESLRNLLSEIVEKHPAFVEGRELSEVVIYRYRFTLLKGLMGLLWLWSKKESNLTPEEESQLLTFLDFENDRLRIYGEGAIPQLIFFYWHLIDRGQREPATRLLHGLTKEVLYRNSDENAPLLASPYYGITSVVKHEISGILEKAEDPFENIKCYGSSFFSKTLLHLLAKSGNKEICQEIWPQYSDLLFEQFIPEEPWQYCLTHTTEGENLSDLPELNKQWEDLLAETNTSNVTCIPSVLLEHPFLLATFILLFPYRGNLEVIKRLEELVVAPSKGGASVPSSSESAIVRRKIVKA